MRPLEFCLVALLLASLVAPLFPGAARLRWLAFLPATSMLVLVLQIVFEHYRWQMLPAYALALGLFVAWLLSLRQQKPTPRRWPLLVGALGLSALLTAAIPPLVLPVPQMPAPGGPYRVGTATYDLTDPTRDELYTADPADKRELMVQIWYPASPAPGAQTSPWMQQAGNVGPAMASFLGLPSFALDHMVLVQTHSYPNAPIASDIDRYPVVVYSHGWNSFRAVNTNQMEALASHGYVAVAIDHSYGAMMTVFDDGRVAPNNPAALPEDAPPAAYQHAGEVLEQTFAGDIRFVLDQLERLDAGAIDNRFAGRLDMGRVGLFGHSTGGGAITLVCSRDPRCKAGLGMDAWLEPVPETIIPGPLKQPFMFMRSELWGSAKNQARLDQLYRQMAGPGYRLTILGTNHFDFTLLPLLSPLTPALGLKGPLASDRTLQIITDYLVAFFDKHLKHISTPLLDGPAPNYPEVRFESRP